MENSALQSSSSHLALPLEVRVAFTWRTASRARKRLSLKSVPRSKIEVVLNVRIESTPKTQDGEDYCHTLEHPMQTENGRAVTGANN